MPESGPKARDNSVVVAGSGFYEQQSLDVFLSPEQTVHSTFVDRSTIRFTLPVGIVLPSIQVALDASMRNALTYTLYDEPTSFKVYDPSRLDDVEANPNVFSWSHRRERRRAGTRSN